MVNPELLATWAIQQAEEDRDDADLAFQDAFNWWGDAEAQDDYNEQVYPEAAPYLTADEVIAYAGCRQYAAEKLNLAAGDMDVAGSSFAEGDEFLWLAYGEFGGNNFAQAKEYAEAATYHFDGFQFDAARSRYSDAADRYFEAWGYYRQAYSILEPHLGMGGMGP